MGGEEEGEGWVSSRRMLYVVDGGERRGEQRPELEDEGDRPRRLGNKSDNYKNTAAGSSS